MILVVDDEPGVVETISSALEEVGRPVATAHDGLEAFELLRHGLRPCLTILDLVMPRMNGWELRDEMLADEAMADIPVALLSALSLNEVRQLRVAAVIHKPFELDEVMLLADLHCGGPAQDSAGR